MSHCFLDFCVGVGAFVIGLSQIFFFSFQTTLYPHFKTQNAVCNVLQIAL